MDRLSHTIASLKAKLGRQRDSCLNTEAHIQALESLDQQITIADELEDSRVSSGKPAKK